MSQTTKRALEASLKKLLLQKPLNKITINDITEDCGVNIIMFFDLDAYNRFNMSKEEIELADANKDEKE